jgi:hypothetical protein
MKRVLRILTSSIIGGVPVYFKERKRVDTKRDAKSIMDDLIEKAKIQINEASEGIGEIQTVPSSGAGDPVLMVDNSAVGSEKFRLEGLPKTTCSVCNENKVRLRKKTPKKVSRQYYENEIGEAWNGRRCPSCNQAKAREAMRKKRSVI